MAPMRRLAKDNMTSRGDSSWSHFSLKNTPVPHAYCHHMTSYLEAQGAVSKAYNGPCQLTIEFLHQY